MYQVIENLARRIMEWAIDKRSSQRYIVSEVSEAFSFHPLRVNRSGKTLQDLFIKH